MSIPSRSRLISAWRKSRGPPLEVARSFAAANVNGQACLPDRSAADLNSERSTDRAAGPITRQTDRTANLRASRNRPRVTGRCANLKADRMAGQIKEGKAEGFRLQEPPRRATELIEDQKIGRPLAGLRDHRRGPIEVGIRDPEPGRNGRNSSLVDRIGVVANDAGNDRRPKHWAAKWLAWLERNIRWN